MAGTKGKIRCKQTGGASMEMNGLALHETMETHEILNFKTVCLLNSKLMQGICFDNDLKRLMEKDVQQSIKDINELLGFYKQSQLLQ
jgi:similar to spore coat protein